MKETIMELCKIFGPSGQEDRVRDYIANIIKDDVDEINIDKLGNLIGIKRGGPKKIMLAAHMDEIGLMITHIEKNGFLRFTNIGGQDVFKLLGHKIISSKGIYGCIHKEEKCENKNLKMDNMYIDIGARSKVEAESFIRIGDMVTMTGSSHDLGDRLISKAMDNRIGCYVLMEVIKKVKNPINTLYFVFTVQEEVGLRGAKTAAYQIYPDVGIAVDVTSTGDTPESRTMAVELGMGPTIKIKDNSMIVHPKIKEMLESSAKRHEISYQYEVLEYGGTDSGAIHLTKEGVPSGVISIPCRYIHSSTEMIDFNDVKGAIELISAFVTTDIVL